MLRQLGLKLAFTLDTHIHADHVSAACRLRQLTGSKVAYPAMDGLPCADIGVAEGVPLKVLQERERHPRLGAGKSIEEFVRIMAELKLPYPRKIDAAVPATRECGNFPDDAVAALDRLGGTLQQG